MTPTYPEPRGLLKGKTVVITAAAGTGIGFSAAKRATEEGAEVLISDFHERRLGEAADMIAQETGKRPDMCVCDVTRTVGTSSYNTLSITNYTRADVLTSVL
jgi:3-oxoacyl-[acyl-carrier protein] reductase